MDGPPAVTSKRFDELDVREFHDIVRLRCDVFVVEQECAYPDLDGRDVDPGTCHHWIEEGGEIVAYARTLDEPGGGTRIGRVVTAPAARGRGLSARIVDALSSMSTPPVVLDAQAHLVDWYGRLGYESVGEEFLEDGIPHVPMRLTAP